MLAEGSNSPVVAPLDGAPPRDDVAPATESIICIAQSDRTPLVPTVVALRGPVVAIFLIDALWLLFQMLSRMPWPRSVGMVRLVTVGMVVGAMFIALMAVLMRRRGSADSRRVTFDTLHTPGRIRLVDSREALDAMGILHAHSFEPAVFRIWFVNSTPMLTNFAIVAIAMILGIGMQVIWALCFGSTWLPGGVSHGGGFVLALGSMCYFQQSYIRITPGRFEILHFFSHWDFSNRRIVHDLRASEVLIDPSNSCIHIGETAYSFAMMFRRKEFIHHVLLAAIAPQNPPELLEDQLVG